MHQPVTEIYHIRLNTGEDLISEVVWPETKPGNEGHVVLVNPMKIICIPSNKPGFVSLSLMQWIFSKITQEQEFNIFSRDILTMSRPNVNLREYYVETVDYFNKKVSNNIAEYLDDLEKEIQAVETSDKLVDNELVDSDLEKLITDFLSTLSSNNKGTLH
jgi:hypothetical protein